MTFYVINYVDEKKHYHTLYCRTIFERNFTLGELHAQGFKPTIAIKVV